MRFKGRGSLFVHLFDPLFDFQGQVRSLQDAVAATKQDAQREAGSGEIVGSARFLAVAGECDVLLQLDLTDLRAVSLLQSHLLGANVQSAAWVLSVPYDLPLDNREESSPSGSREAAVTRTSPPVHFVTHLRFHRAVYRILGGEALVLERIAELLRKASGVKGELHTNLGWFDLLITGSFTGPATEFTGFLARVSGLNFGSESANLPAVRKTLTLLAFEGGTGTLSPFDNPLIVARTSSAAYTRATRFLEDQFRELEPNLFLLDGTRDLLILAGEGARPQTIDRLLVALSDRGGRFYEEGVERVETHLLATRPSRLGEFAGTEPIEVSAETKLERNCTCTQLCETLRNLGRQVEDVDVREGLQLTVRNVLTLQSFALRDSTHCCDVRPAIVACAAALGRLLKGMHRLQRLREEVPGHAQYWYEALHKRRELLDHWCRSSEAILSERLAGGFQEFFDVNDRVVAYRGGVQKLLFVTDHLLNSFLAEIDPPVEDLGSSRALFATWHEPISAIRSEPNLGFVKVPLRHRFSLPMVLPQLWHEVGQFVFRLRYPVPEGSETQKRLKKLEQRLKHRALYLRRRRKELVKEQESALGGTADRSSFRQLGRQIKSIDDQLKELAEHSSRVRDYGLRLLADMYADLIVFIFGFRGDFPQFVHYLVALYFDLARAEQQTDEAWERACDVLLIRLYFVSQLALLWQGERERRSKGWKRCRVDFLVSWVEKLASRYRGRGRALPALPAELRIRVYHNVAETKVAEFFEEYIGDFLGDYVSRRDKLFSRDENLDEAIGQRVEQGEVVEIEAQRHINDYYGLVYARLLEERLGLAPQRPREVHFREMAALGKSALLAFYREGP